ncbi:MAG: RDD family protein [Acidimicrobiales bacterium]
MTAGDSADPTAVTGRRIAAFFIDVVVYWAVIVAPVAAFPGPTTAVIKNGKTTYQNNGAFGAQVASFLILILYGIGMFVVARGLTGRTLGLKVMNLQCVNYQGNPPGVPLAAWRVVAGWVDWITILFIPVGLLVMTSSKGHRRVGDMAAKTFVVDQSQAGRPPLVAGVTAPIPPPPPPLAGQPGAH